MLLKQHFPLSEAFHKYYFQKYFHAVMSRNTKRQLIKNFKCVTGRKQSWRAQ